MSASARRKIAAAQKLKSSKSTVGEGEGGEEEGGVRHDAR